MKYLQKIMMVVLVFVLALTNVFPAGWLDASCICLADEPDDSLVSDETTPVSEPLPEPEPQPEPVREPEPQPTEKVEQTPQPVAEEETPAEAPSPKPEETTGEETESTAEPTPQSSEEPMPQPTVEETGNPEEEAEQKPLTVSDPHADKDLYELHETIQWRIQVKGAVKADYRITNASGAECAQGNVPAEALEQGIVTVSFSAGAADYYVLNFQASSEKESKQVTAKAAVRSGNLEMKMRTKQRSAFAGETVTYQAEWDGGLWPYQVNYRISTNGKAAEQYKLEVERDRQTLIQFVPQTFGDCRIEVTVTDSTGLKAESAATIPVAVNEYEPRWKWEAGVKKAHLTGDWREDLIAVARTQIGVRESRRNFIIDKDGQRKGYTRYGDWYGAPYSNWCAMFICFCLHYADIPTAYFPHDANCQEWKEKLQYIGVYENRTYVPETGDLVFFSTDRSRIPGHVGIVYKVTDTTICTIEGNTENHVTYSYYSLGYSKIVGYANMRTVMKHAGVLTENENSAVDSEFRRGNVQIR